MSVAVPVVGDRRAHGALVGSDAATGAGAGAGGVPPGCEAGLDAAGDVLWATPSPFLEGHALTAVLASGSTAATPLAARGIDMQCDGTRR